jgi:uracil-DNA glycosylase
MNKKIRSFYIKVMNCTYTKCQCSHAWKDFSEGVVPRGFRACTSNTVKILVVGKNPGHPLEGETDFYKGKKGEDLFKAKEKWDSERYKLIQTTNDPSLKYHINLIRYLRYFLGLSKKLETYKGYKKNYVQDHETEISEQVAFTNLFKCSMVHEQEKIKNASFDICYQKYFMREIGLIKPQAILALGDEVAKFLKKKQLKVPLVSIKHPSYFNRKNDEIGILRKEKKKLTNMLKP